MKQKMFKVVLKNDHDPENLHNSLMKLVHPLSAFPNADAKHVAVVPAWLDSLPNKVAMKQAFLEIIKGDDVAASNW